MRLIDVKKLPYSLAVDDNGKQIFYVKAKDIDNAPTIDPESLRPKGRWKYYNKQNIAVCTHCSFERGLDENFGRAVSCPNCGARMEG